MSRKTDKTPKREQKPLFDDLCGVVLWFVHAMLIISLSIAITFGIANSLLPNLGVYLMENAGVTNETSLLSLVIIVFIPEIFFSIVLALGEVAFIRFVNAKLGKLRQNMLNRAIIWYNEFKVSRAKKKLTK